jgi:hypothetical protein
VRDDLADVELADRVFAPHYARALASILTSPSMVYSGPAADTVAIDNVSAGTTLDVFDISGGWAWVRTEKGIGYIRADCITPA